MFTIENSNNETKNKSAKYQEKEKMKKKRNINSSTHSIFQDILESYANIVLNTQFQS